MNEWWEDLFAERHRFFPDADYYATPQRLQASPDKMSRRGAIEWICPVRDDGGEDPPTELTTYIDPFGPGKPDSSERQAMMIAKRIQALTQQRPTRVMREDGEWEEISAPEEPVRYSDIMVLMASRSKIRDALLRHLATTIFQLPIVRRLDASSSRRRIRWFSPIHRTSDKPLRSGLGRAFIAYWNERRQPAVFPRRVQKRKSA